MRFLTELKEQISILLNDQELLIEVSQYMNDGSFIERELKNLLSQTEKQILSIEAQRKPSKPSQPGIYTAQNLPTNKNPELSQDAGFLYGKFLVPLTIIQNKIEEVIAYETRLAQKTKKVPKLEKLEQFKNAISAIVGMYLKRNLSSENNKAIAAYLTNLVTETKKSFNLFTFIDKIPLPSALESLNNREAIEDKLYEATLAQLNACSLYDFTFKRFLLTYKKDGVDVKIDTIAVQYAPTSNNSELRAQDCYHMIWCNGNASFAVEMLPEALKIAQDLYKKLGKPIVITLFDYPGVLSSTHQSNSLQDLVDALERVVEYYQKLNVPGGRMILVGQSMGAAPAIIVTRQLHCQAEPYRVFGISLRGFKNAAAAGAEMFRLPKIILATIIASWDRDIAPDFLEIPERYKYFFKGQNDKVIQDQASLAQGIIDVMVPPKSSSNFMGSVSSARTAVALPLSRPKTIPWCEAGVRDEQKINQAITNCTLIPNNPDAAANMHNADLSALSVFVDGEERNAHDEFINICVTFYKRDNAHDFQPIPALPITQTLWEKSNTQVTNNNNNNTNSPEEITDKKILTFLALPEKVLISTKFFSIILVYKKIEDEKNFVHNLKDSINSIGLGELLKDQDISVYYKDDQIRVQLDFENLQSLKLCLEKIKDLEITEVSIAGMGCN